MTHKDRAILAQPGKESMDEGHRRRFEDQLSWRQGRNECRSTWRRKSKRKENEMKILMTVILQKSTTSRESFFSIRKQYRTGLSTNLKFVGFIYG